MYELHLGPAIAQHVRYIHYTWILLAKIANNISCRNIYSRHNQLIFVIDNNLTTLKT